VAETDHSRRTDSGHNIAGATPMKFISDLSFRIRALFQRQAAETDLDDELRSHLEHEVDKRVRAGAPSDAAIRDARAAFGGVERIKEETRESRGLNFIENLAQDIRYGLRMMVKTPSFTAVAVLTLALGIGANTAVFSLVNGVVLRPLPLPEPDRMVAMTGGEYTKGPFSFIRAQSRTMDVAAYADEAEFNWTGIDRPLRIAGASVSANYFSALGVAPEVGRTFQQGEDQPGADRVVILSHALWDHRFGRATNVIGNRILLEGVSREIIGVMPAGFRFPSTKAELWVPLHLDPKDIGDYWYSSYMPVIARLRPGTTIGQAQAELAALRKPMLAQFPYPLPADSWQKASLTSLQERIVGDEREKLLILLGAVGLLLLIACANVANLLLVRAATRQKEVAVRTALGAGRWRIMRQLITESVMLSVLGGTIGMGVAIYGLPALKSLLPADTPRLADVTVDGRVLLFVALLMVATGIVFGAAPAFGASKVDLTNSLKAGGQRGVAGGNHRLSKSLVVGEVAISVVLVIGAGLLVKSLWLLSNVDPGFRCETILTARITPDETFCEVAGRCQMFYSDLLGRIRALPGVTEVAAVNELPLGGGGEVLPVDIEAHPTRPGAHNHLLLEKLVTTDYLSTMGIPILKGRGLNELDTSAHSQWVVLVSKSTAELFWPGIDPVGQRIKVKFQDQWRTVVGVVGDVRESTMAVPLESYLEGVIYVAYGQQAVQGSGTEAPPAEMTLVMRTSQENSQIGAELTGIVAGVSHDVPVTHVEPLQGRIVESVAGPRSTALLFSFFSALALALGAVGIYGVISYSVEQRTREIGIRMALGARPGTIMRLIVGQGAKLAVGGVLVGVVSALALTRLMAGLLYGVGATDSLTFFGVELLLFLVAIAASYIPARRAMRVDPMTALRTE